MKLPVGSRGVMLACGCGLLADSPWKAMIAFILFGLVTLPKDNS